VLNALVSKLYNAHQAAGISSKKINLTPTTKTSRFTLKAFKESADGSAHVFVMI